MTTKKPIKKKVAKKRAYTTTKNAFVANVDSIITQTICSNIRVLYFKKKKEKNWTQKDFGNHIGVPEPYIKAVLQKRFAPSHAVIAQISKLFGISVDEIYGLERKV